MASNTRSGKSPARVAQASSIKEAKVQPYTSHGVKDNNIFSLKNSEWSILAILTAIGTVVRLFRIYQPTSVVFDEVQYVSNSKSSGEISEC